MKIRLRKRERSLGQLLFDYIGPFLLTRLVFGYRLLVPKRQENNDLILFSHRFGGNIKALYDYAKNIKNSPFKFYYLADEYSYYKDLIRQNPEITILSPLNIKHLLKVADSSVFISTHGPIVFNIFTKLPKRSVFVEVWHGLGYKKFTPEGFRLIHSYDAVFVSSPFFKTFYKKWGFKDSQIKLTGCAVSDPLVKGTQDRGSILDEFGFHDLGKKIVLFAPTYTHGNNKQSIFPFSVDEDTFLKTLNQLGREENFLFVIRPHLNTDLTPPTAELENIKFLQFADNSKLLPITDVLITDWSSIASDFLILNKPIIFLDIPPTFRGYEPLTPTDRAGYLGKNFDELKKYIRISIRRPKDYKERFKTLRKQVLKKCFEDTLDGKSSERYLREIEKLLSKKRRGTP